MVLPTQQFWTFGLQNREGINFSCFKPPVCGPLFPPPREAPFFPHVALRGARASHGATRVGSGFRFCRMMNRYRLSRPELGFPVLQPIAPLLTPWEQRKAGKISPMTKQQKA